MSRDPRRTPAGRPGTRPGTRPGGDPAGADEAEGPDGADGAGSVEEQVARELHRLRQEIPGVLACLVATVDGLLVADDGSDLPAPQLAALTSTLTGLARHAVEVTRRGELLDAVIRGSDGHLAVFTVGDAAVLAVVAHPDVTVAWLHVRTRPVVQRLARLADGFGRFYTG